MYSGISETIDHDIWKLIVCIKFLQIGYSLSTYNTMSLNDDPSQA